MTSTESNPLAVRWEMINKQLRARGIADPALLEAFGQVPRELFVPAERRHEAYEDRPIPIGHGQTISQPFIVALMIQELQLHPGHRVYEVGAGCGYQTAILARLARHVYAIERIEALTERAMAAVTQLNASNITLATGDGSLGWPEEAPFDRIICSAAAPDVPEVWIDQVVEGGRIVLPVGGRDVQVLLAVEKRGGKLIRREVCDVRFVRLIGRHAWPESEP